jgi:hypothetical protein
MIEKVNAKKEQRDWLGIIAILFWEIVMAAFVIYSQYFMHRMDMAAVGLIAMVLGLVMLQGREINKLKKLIK